MTWYRKHKNTVPLERRIRYEWVRGGALKTFEKIKSLIPVEYHDLERLGCFDTGATIGSAPYRFSVPLREDFLYSHLLKDETEVALINKKGDVLFRGKWMNTTQEMFADDPECYVFVVTLPLIKVSPA